MVAVEITRQNVEVLADPGAVVGVSRTDVEVATPAAEASTGTAQITRQCFEVLAKTPQKGSISRVDVEVATDPRDASAEPVLVSRQSMEIIASPLREAAVTRVDVEVGTPGTPASTGPAEITRQSIEALARRGSAGLVVPLPLPDADYDIFLHNWATSLQLSTSYPASLGRSAATGAESRRGLSLKPDRSMRLEWRSNDVATLDRLYVALRRITDERGPMPLYNDQREIPAAYVAADDTVFVDTSQGRWFVGARVVIVQFDACAQFKSRSFHIISDLQDDRLVFDAPLGVDVAVGSVVMPMMDCEVALEVEMTADTARNNMVSLEVLEVAGASALPPVKADFPTMAQSFGDYPIFDVDPDWVEGVSRGRSRQGKSISQGRGQQVVPEAARSRQTHGLDLNGDRDTMWRVVEFFDTRRGQTRTFWFIDYEFIWETAEIDASGNFIGVSELGDFDDFKEELEGGYVGIVMEDGTRYVREVTTVQQILTVFRLTLGTPLPAGLLPANVVRIARARLTRFADEEMTEEWLHTGYMATSLNFIEVLEEKDVTT